MKKIFLSGVISIVCLSCFALTVFAGLYGDFTGDGAVEMNDLPCFFDLWLVNDCNETNEVDLDENCIINSYEFSVLANNWKLHIPAAPTGLAAAAGDGTVSLDWDDNTEDNLAGYNIYRSQTSGADFAQINTLLLTGSDYDDTAVANGTTYYYVVTAVDTASNESDDSNEVSATPSDTTPPIPNPMTFATAPHAASSTSIAMTAATASDTSGVEYYFTCTAGGGHDSGWQSGTSYMDTGLTPSTLYTYTVKARDLSIAHNETAASGPASATTGADTTPPIPNPMTFATAPHAANSTSIAMTATTATDISGVEYYFTCTAGGGHSSGWQASASYTDTSLMPSTMYTYTVKARDLSAAHNETTASSPASATTLGTPSNNIPQNLMVPPMAWDDTQIILIWSKPQDYSQVTDYRVYKDGTPLGLSGRFDTTRPKLFYIVTGLTPNTTYNFTVRSVLSGGGESADSNSCIKTTTAAPAVFYPESYGAAANGTTKDTAAIQAAINACTAGGKVHLRAGKTFLSGAIFLKSNMTLQIDGTLLGSSSPADYPYTSLRFPYYASGNNYMGLVNAYHDYMNPSSAGQPYGTITNVRICGSGVINGCQGYSVSNPHTITGHGNTTLGAAESALHGETNRGDMVTVKGVNQVYVGGWNGTLTLVYPSEHTIFVSYCNNVTVNAVDCQAYDIHNGDGINLCTSDTAYIFNSYFDTGDDCINMNAGQGLEGVNDGYPDQNIRVFDCTTERGHGGYVIGSFTAAWVQDSLIEDCFFQNTDVSNGIAIRMKTGNNNGGGGRRITCRDIRISGCSRQGIFLDSTYNASGYTSAGPGQFSYNTFKNISVTSTGDSIYINGLSGTPHTQNIFENITGNKRAYLNYCTNSTFINVTVPSWTVGSGCTGNASSGCPGCPF